MKLVTVAQMRELEARAVAAGKRELDLMDEAGLAAAQETWMSLGALEDRLVLVLAGPGNNGGDGMVAGIHLKQFDADVHVYLLEPRAEDDPAWQALQDHEIPSTTVADDPGFEKLDEMLGRAAGVLDALLGIGSNRPVEGNLAEVLKRLRAARERPRKPHLVALDVPSGVNADTGHADPHTVAADITVCFGYVKVGMYQLPARTLGGNIVRAEIGIADELGADLPYEEIDYRMAQRAMPARPLDAHKGTFGRAVLAVGSRRYPGAARLAAEACARSGAGLTVIAAPEVAQPLIATAFVDAVHEPLPSTDGVVDGDAARALLRALPGAQALLVGPGLDHTPASEEFMRTLLAGLDAVEGLRAVVIDADGLNAVAPQRDWHRASRVPRVLTPHPGEMARLLSSTVEDVQSDRLRHATEYAKASGSVVVLKGACTVIAAPDGRARLSSAANPMLAHAGTGDVLAGLIVGLIAQGADPYDAASAGVYIHSETGAIVAKEYGAAAGLAQDLLRTLPDVRKSLDAN